MSDFIKARDLKYLYDEENEELKALNDISLDILKGSFTIVLGKNGSGKSTFARLINALLIPSEGTIVVDGIDTSDKDMVWEIRRKAGMVFQNPDNQMVASEVVEDIAFGPENLGVPPEEIRKRVYDVMKFLSIEEFEHRSPSKLSGGQKQKVAIAGVLAMKPDCIILDEATAMLDPEGRKEVLDVLEKLNKENNITIIHITHHMDEAINADRLVVIDEGKVVIDGAPGNVFSNVEKLEAIGLEVPEVSKILFNLAKYNDKIDTSILDIDRAAEEIVRIIKGN